jgi:Transport and Golgi organisation 2
MCTVTFFPKGDNGFILTSNRDEGILRPQAIAPKRYSIGNNVIVFPKDTAANGTWIATGSNNYTLCLLNGAFEKHLHQPPYRKSRGIMLLDFFEYSAVSDFISNYSFNNIEPFTLIIIHSESTLVLGELRWDGEQLFYVEKEVSKAHIWSSATLYKAETRKEREQWFDEWKKNNSDPQVEDLLHFHNFAGTGNKHTNVLMNLDNKVFTVSITSISKINNSSSIYYKDLISGEEKKCRIFN